MMTKYLLVLSLCLNTIIVWGQNTQSNDTVLLNSNPPITQKMVDSYTNFYEWHFELRLNPEQRQKFQSLLVEDLKNGKLVAEVVEKTQYMEEFKKKGWMELFSAHSNLKQTDSIEIATQDTLNGKGSEVYADPLIEIYGGKKTEPAKPADEKIYGSGIYANLRKSGKSGHRSSEHLLNQIKEYQKPIVGDGTFRTSLFQKDIDATFEWTTFRMVIVAGKRVAQGNQTERSLMAQRITKTWNDNKSDPEKLARFKSWLDSNVTEWIMWRAAEYSFFSRQTPFGKKEQLVNWGKEIVGFVPEMKPYLDQRISEYKDYVSKMPNDEIKQEYELKEKTNREFALRMQKMQTEMRDTQKTFAVMREGLRNLHIANLNIAENTGNTGFVWTIKTTP